MNFNKQSILILYVDAICNLQCSYCFIDKNPALISIDEILDESYKDNYYLNFAKEVFPNPEQLTEIQLWGGEPTLKLHRVYNTIESLLNYYPNITEFKMSSNMAHEDFIQEFYGLLKILAKFPERQFTFSLQMSLDGPKDITDLGRGNNVTKKFTENFLKMCFSIENEILSNYPNLQIYAHFKPTLNNITIKMLQTEESLIKYYQFFEHYKEIADNIKNKNFMLFLTIPNTACPSPHTKEEGEEFANLVRLCRKIEKNNPFKFYQKITPFEYQTVPIEQHNIGNCGSGLSTLGLLPNHLISLCHNGFVELISDYKRYCLKHGFNHTIDFNLFDYTMVKNDMIFPYNQLEKKLKELSCFGDCKESFQISSLEGYIQFLADNGQILEKYKEKNEANKAACFLLTHTAYCMRDNLGVTGSKYLQPPGLAKLLLNGAMDYIINES